MARSPSTFASRFFATTGTAGFPLRLILRLAGSVAPILQTSTPGRSRISKRSWAAHTVALQVRLQELAQNEAALTSTLFEGQNPDRLYLDKAWHGIHWLLAKSSGSTDEPLSKLIMGGKPVGVKLAYGQARVHTATEVKTFASLLERIDFEVIAKNYDAAAMDAADIYPIGLGGRA